MATELTLRLITPDRIVLDTRVQYISVPGLDGSIGILPRHAPMVAALDIGVLRFLQDGKQETAFVAGGFAEVRENTVRVLTEAGERSEEIDEERAQRARDRAHERLEEAGDRAVGIDVLRAELAMRRAQQRLLVKRGYARTLV